MQAEAAESRERELRQSADAARNLAVQEKQRAETAEGDALASQQRAETKARANAKTVQFLQELFRSSDPTGLEGLGYRRSDREPTGQLLARDIVKRGVDRIKTELGDQPLVRVELLNALGSVCRSLGMYETAEELLSESVALAQRELQLEGADLESVKLKWAEAARLLARLRHEQGALDQAEDLYRRALQTFADVGGEQSLVVADVKFGLAWVLAERRESQPAEQLMQEALAIRREHLGANHRDVKITGLALLLIRFQQHDDTTAKLASVKKFAATLDAKSNIAIIRGVLTYQTGLIFRRQRKYALAEPCYQETLSLCKSVFDGEDNFLYLMVQGDYAGLLRETGEYRRGEELIREVLAKAPLMLRRRAEVAKAQIELAACLIVKGDHRFAEQMLQEADKAGHRDHVQWGRLHTALGRYDEAERAYRTALSPQYANIYPPAAIAAVGYELGRLQWLRGKLDEAAATYQQHLEAIRRHSPEASRLLQLRDHAQALRGLGREAEAKTLENEARQNARKLIEQNLNFYPFSSHEAPAIVRVLRDEPDAEQLARRWLEESNPADWPHPPVKAAKQFALAEILRRRGKHDEAERLHRQALEIRQEKLGDESADTIKSLLALAATLADLNRGQDAVALVDDALRCCERMFGQGHPWRARFQRQAAEVLQAAGQKQRAEPLLRASVETTLATLTAAHPQYSACVLQLAKLLHGAGQTDAARGVLTDAQKLLAECLPETVPRRRRVEKMLQELGD